MKLLGDINGVVILNITSHAVMAHGGANAAGE